MEINRLIHAIEDGGSVHIGGEIVTSVARLRELHQVAMESRGTGPEPVAPAAIAAQLDPQVLGSPGFAEQIASLVVDKLAEKFGSEGDDEDDDDEGLIQERDELKARLEALPGDIKQAEASILEFKNRNDAQADLITALVGDAVSLKALSSEKLQAVAKFEGVAVQQSWSKNDIVAAILGMRQQGS